MLVTVVFDTNILFSAIGWRGNPFRCVELARAGQIRNPPSQRFPPLSH